MAIKHQTKYATASCIVFQTERRMVVDTSLPHANMMHDGSRPFAVCDKTASGRVWCRARYETLAKAKAALRYLK